MSATHVQSWAECWQELGLERDPFPDHDPDDLFLQTPALGQRLSLFTQLLKASDLTLLLLGEHGIGKTAFAQRMAATLDDSWRVVHWHAWRGAAIDDLLRVLGPGFAVMPGDTRDVDSTDDLSAHAGAMRASGLNPLLVVDDAHSLDDAMLVAVLELGRSLRLALVGQPALAERVADVTDSLVEPDAGLVHRVALTEFSPAQTADYLRARLAHCGWSGASPFSDADVARIHARSGGLPGAINRLAREALEAGPMDVDPAAGAATEAAESLQNELTNHAPVQPRITLHERSAGIGRRLLLPGAVAAVVIAGVVFGLLRDPGPETTSTAANDADASAVDDTAADGTRFPALPEAPPPRPPPVMARPDAPLPPGPVNLDPVPRDTGVGDPDRAGGQSGRAQARTAVDAVQSAGTNSARSPRPRARPAELGPAPAREGGVPPAAVADAARTAAQAPPANGAAAASSTTAESNAASRGNARAPDAGSAGSSRPAASLSAAAAPRPRPRPPLSVLSRQPPPPTPLQRESLPPLERESLPPRSPPVVVRERAAPVASARERARPSTLDDGDATALTGAADSLPEPAVPVDTGVWLSASNRDRYTVQLVALGTEEATNAFIAANGLADALVVTLRTPDGKPLFAVVHGVYDRRDSAAAAIGRFAPGLRDEAPWPRHIGTLLDAALNVRIPQP